jgi:methyltransferase
MNTYNFGWIFAFILLQRLYEVIASKSNYNTLSAMGAQEFHPESFRNIAIMHALYFAALLFESYPWQLPLDLWTILCLIAVITLAGLRLWCMSALRPYWNVRIIVVPGAHVRRTGPYRFLRHPNYWVVVMEFIFLPLLLRAPITMILFSIANLVLLQRRIRLEEEVLRKFTDYDQVFGQ